MIAYRMYADEELILDTQDGVNDGILSANFKLELNKPSSLEFSMVASHPYIDNITMMKTSIILEMMYIDNNDKIKDDYYPFMGRVSAINQDMYGNKTFTCEGGLAFKNDYIVLNDFETYSSLKLNVAFGKCIDTTRNTLTNDIRSGMTGDHYNDGRNIDWTLTTPIQKPAPKTEEGEEPEEEKLTLTYEKSIDMIQSYIIGPYGGVVYYHLFNYDYDDTTNTFPKKIIKDHLIYEIGYYASLLTGFDYIGSNNIMPDEPQRLIELYYGDEIPSFGLNDNIVDIKPNYIKTGIWTGIMPVGKDGLTISGYKNERDTDANTIWNMDLVRKYGYIHKTVNFSQVDSVDALRAFGRNYMARFANNDYYAMQTYEINGIEPCEVFEPTRYLVKLGYYVILQLNANTLISFPCLSIEHNLFDIQQSRYVIGPVVPDTILNEDFTAVYH